MASVADAFVRFLADTKDVDAALNQRIPAQADKAGQVAGNKFGSQIGKAVTTAVGAGAGLAFSSAIEGATAFEDQLRTINTVAKLSDDQLSKTGKDILELSKVSGKSTDDLTAGFYDLVSAGIPADKAIKVLKDSAVLATGALSTTGEAVDLVTSALGAYGLSADKSTRVTDIFAQAVADGKTTAADLAAGISQVAPIAAQTGVSLEEVASSAALMTLRGDTASQAFTKMKASIVAILTPNEQLNELQQKSGKNFLEMLKQGVPLKDVLDEIRKATGGSDEAFAKALGSSDALSYALSVTGENAGAAATELNKIKDGADAGGVALGQYDEAQKSAAAGGRRLTAQIKAFLIEFGGPFVQTLGPGLQAINLLAPAFLSGGRAGKIFGAVIGGITGRAIIPAIAALKNLAAAGKLGGFLQDISLGRNLLSSVKGTAIGGKIATLIGAGIAKSTAIAAGVGAALDAVPGSNLVKSAVAKGSAALGGAYGKGVALAMKAGIVLGVAEIAESIKGPVIKIAQDAHDAIFQGPLEGVGDFLEGVGKAVNDLPWPLGPKGAPDWAGGKGDAAAGGKEVGQYYGKGVAQGVAEGVGSVPATLRDASPQVRQAASGVGDAIKEPIVTAVRGAYSRVAEMRHNIVSTINQLRTDLNTAATQAANALYDPIIKAAEAAETAAEIAAAQKKLRDKNTTAAEKKELQLRIFELRKQQLIQNADLLTYGTQAEQISKTKAFLASKFWVDAYKDATPEQRAALDEWKATLQGRLDAMEGAAKQGGRDVRDGFTGPIRNGRDDVNSAVTYMTGGAAAAFKAAQAAARRSGKSVGEAYAAGLEASWGAVHSAATYVASGATGPMKASSPPKEGPLQFIDVWGKKVMQTYAQSMREGFSDVRSAALYAVSGAAQPLTETRFSPMIAPVIVADAMRADRRAGVAPALTRGEGNVYQQVNNVELQGLVKARDPFEIPAALERFQRTGLLEWPEEPK